MAATIPDSHKDLIDGPVFVTLTTLMPDNQPQSSVVWCNSDGEHVLVNTALHRQKARNVQERPKVTIMAVDPDNPFRYLEVRGEVVEVTEDGAMNHIDELAKLYMGIDSYYGELAPAEQKEQETRVLCKIKPTRVRAYGG